MSGFRRNIMMFTRPIESQGVPAPTISPASGSILSSQVISIGIAGSAVSAEYSFDSSTWTSYTSPFTLSSDATVYARALDADGNYSNVTSNSYVILPYDAQVEYLQSSGTQYIQLDFGFDITDEVDAYISVDTSQTSDKYMNSAQTWNNKNNRFGIGVHYGGKYTCAIGNISTSNSVLQPQTTNDGNLHHWTYANKVFQVVDLSLSYTFGGTFGGTTTNLKLFYGYNSNTKGKIQAYKHTKGGLVVCDFIPVRVGQVGYMYDRVNGQLFGNTGTGDFILGNDVTN